MPNNGMIQSGLADWVKDYFIHLGWTGFFFFLFNQYLQEKWENAKFKQRPWKSASVVRSEKKGWYAVTSYVFILFEIKQIY